MNESPSSAPAASATAAAPAPHRHRLLHWTLGVLLALLLLVGGGLAWLWHSDAGTATLLSHVPGLTLQGQRGRLTGGPFAVDKLVWHSGTLRMEVDGLSWRDAQWRLHPYRGAYAGLALVQPRAQRVVVTTLPPAQPQPKAKPPANLKLPIELIAPDLQVATLQVGSGAAITGLRADLHFGANDGAEHRIEHLALERAGVAVRGSTTIGAAAPMPVRGAIGAADAPDAPHAWRAGVRLGGTLTQLLLDAHLQLAPSAQAQAQAGIAPFAAWPLASLHAQWQGVDLADFAPTLPHTALAGSVRSLAAAPADATHRQPDPGSAPLQLTLTNAEPGAWDAHRLPVAALQAVLHGRPGDGSPLRLDPLVVDLAGARPAGRVEGHATWNVQQLQAQAQLQAVQPRQLLGAAPALRLDGPLQLTLAGLALPGQPPAGGAQHGGLQGTLKAQIAAAFDERPHAPPAQLRADAGFAQTPDGGLQLTLTQLDAQAGRGHAEATAHALRDARGAWQLRSQGELARFDPGVWWPAAGRGGASDVNARWNADVALLAPPATAQRSAAAATASGTATTAAATTSGTSASSPATGASHTATASAAVPASAASGTATTSAASAISPASDAADQAAATRVAAAAPSRSLADLLAALRGRADVTIAPSRLAGLPLTGRLQLQADDARTTLDAALDAARNTLRLQGQPRGGTPHWQADVQAPALAALAPLRAWLPQAAAAWFPDRGSAQAQASADGQGSALRTTGTLQARGLHSAAFALAQADGRWQLAPHEPQAPLQLQLDGRGLALGTHHVERLQARLDGTAASHRLRLDADAPLSPPAWLVALNSSPAGTATASASPTAALSAGTGTGTPVSAPVTVTPQGQIKASTRDLDATARGSAPAAGAGAASSHRSAAPRHAGSGRRTAAPPHGSTATASSTATPPVDAGTALHLALQGHWQPQADGSGRWQGVLHTLQALPQTGGPAWLATHDLRAQLQLDAAGHPVALTLAPGRLVVFGGAVRWREAAWHAAAGRDARSRIALDAQIEPLQVAPWLAALQPQYGWHGDLTLAGHVVLHTGAALAADVLIARQHGDLALRFQGVPHPLGLSALQLALTSQHGRWQVSENVAGSHLGTLQGRQTAGTAEGALLPATGSPLGGSLALHVPDLAVWSPWLPAGWQAAGRVQAQLALGGRIGAPQISGRIGGQQLAVDDLFEGVHLRDGSVAIALQGDHARIERFVFHSAGGGTLQASGGAQFAATPSAQVQVVAQRLRALDRVDRQVTVSGRANAGLQSQHLALTGRFHIDSGLVDIAQSEAPQLGKDVVVIDRTHAAPTVMAQGGNDAANGGDAANTSGTASTNTNTSTSTSTSTGANADAGAKRPLSTDLDVAIDLGDALRLRGHGLDTLLRGQLDVTTPKGQLMVNGVIRTEQGTYKAYGQNLIIERGRLMFHGPVANPTLDVLALRPDLDAVRVGVQVTGPASDPRIALYSDPSMTQMDTLTWLVLGRAPEGLGQDDTALLQRAALALFAGDKGTGGKSFAQHFGLDQISVHENGNGAGASAAGTIVSLGKQVSKRLFIGYEHALAGTTGAWDLIYRLFGRFSIEARSGDQNSVDAVWTWRWD